MSQAYHVGLIGVGLMGHGIARNLLSSGHRLSFLQHPGNQPVDDLVAAGATPLESGCTVTQNVDVVILCVTGSPQVNAVLFDAAGVLEGLRPGTVVIDCSTALPSSTSDVARRVNEAGGRFMDAAMTRTPKEAEEGRLNPVSYTHLTLPKRCLPRCYHYLIASLRRSFMPATWGQAIH